MGLSIAFGWICVELVGFSSLLWDCKELVAEREGFEPPEPFGSMVFKTTAFDHSAISPLEGGKV